MKTTFISTNSMSAATRQALAKVQQQLADAHLEMTTSRYADVGKTLGYKAGDTISLRQEFARLNTIIDTNSTVTSRLKSSQSVLQNLVDTGRDFVGQLLGSRVGGASALNVKAEAQSRLDGFIDAMNMAFGDGYLFAGVNSDVKPMADYFSTPASASKQSVANAFFAEFGIYQDDPAAANISAADMQTFLDTTFSDLFADPAWTSDWSSASSQNARSRISSSELLETSTNANESAFRKFAQAYTMIADLGVENLGQPAFEAIIDKATQLVNEAIQEVGDLQARLGISEQRVGDASERMKLQVDILTRQVKTLEEVDPNEAAVRINQMLTQMEISYALTSRIMGLSLLKYI
ncbi:flagellar hook-associated family protein [Hyphomicrobium sulfonivorans]|uniref:Flagellin n=1 Tax=Hyphomicrobium sulfonivorans TaxID=121290 RepID=A0A109BFY8_HYPSL|nr:flagellar hook-associated family protein [Hyphomicrobium sulfonivorans]KWT67427.1 hypothetical protein APY04_1992 [Hyphomicrobium sulfonivorans]MBI1648743.1 flagellar hook-associated family protein [Hyphomicrobium sulfonivorans]